MRQRYNVRVYIRRNAQKCYSYTMNAQPMRESRVFAAFDNAVWDVAGQGARGDKVSYAWYARGCVIRTGGIKAIVRIVRA